MQKAMLPRLPSAGDITNDAGVTMALPGTWSFLLKHPLVQIDLIRPIHITDNPPSPTSLEVHNRRIRTRFCGMVVGFVHRKHAFDDDQSSHKESQVELSAETNLKMLFDSRNMFPIMTKLEGFDVQPLRLLFQSDRSDLIESTTPFSGKGAFWLFGQPPSFTRRHQLSLLRRAIKADVPRAGAKPYKLVTTSDQLQPPVKLDFDFDEDVVTQEEALEQDKNVTQYEEYALKDEGCQQALQPVVGMENQNPEVDEVFIALARCQNYDDANIICSSALDAIDRSTAAQEVRNCTNLAAAVYNETIAVWRAKRRRSKVIEDSEPATENVELPDDETF